MIYVRKINVFVVAAKTRLNDPGKRRSLAPLLTGNFGFKACALRELGPTSLRIPASPARPPTQASLNRYQTTGVGGLSLCEAAAPEAREPPSPPTSASGSARGPSQAPPSHSEPLHVKLPAFHPASQSAPCLRKRLSSPTPPSFP